MKFSLKKELLRFLAEDLGKGDITSALLPRNKIKAKIISRQNSVVAGARYAKEIFVLRGCNVKILKKDASKVKRNQTILEIFGTPQAILSCERTALNLLSRMSGIATQTNNLVKKIPRKTKLYATRKTAPGLRFFDKEAVKIGGGEKHRMSLDQMIMLKDNHLLIGGSIEKLVKKAKSKYSQVEIEVENQKDAILAAKAGATIVMLDNFSPSKVSRTIAALKKLGLRKKVKVEASGGINASNIHLFAKTGIDMISMGEVTDSVIGIDLSLEVST
ncbi:MAG: carboxylating nicotinate-nucleotide diphosphorylase [Thaumarchaeota archaeon]|nr:carboxylating nicotinate-nucleotide diphosphorylase [Nitrososphaerota archaeon]